MRIRIENDVYEGTPMEIMEQLFEGSFDQEQFPNIESYIRYQCRNFTRMTDIPCQYERDIHAQARALIAVLALFSSFGPTVALANLGATLQNTFAAGNRVLDILDEAPVVDEVTGQPEVEFTGAEAEHVTFSYGGEDILSDVSVRFPEGSVVGIVGRSGSGKSTLLKLLMRFWDVQKGRVRLSGTDVSSINTGNLREMESFVTQETHLFHDSIKNNLRSAKLDATDDEIVAACKKAAVHEFIMTLPQGYDTPVGELGDTLSGGERQRVFLAMLLAQNTDVVLLDEPTTYLDAHHKFELMALLSTLKAQNKAVGIVLHELPLAFKFCDRLLLMKNGQIMQSGTPEELLKTGLIEHLFGVSLTPVMLDKEVEYIERKIHS